MPLTRPAILLRIEELALLTAIVLLYHHLHFSWLTFVILFLAPDLFMLGYLLNARIGAALYNLAHTLFIPLMLLAARTLPPAPHSQRSPSSGQPTSPSTDSSATASNTPPNSKTPTSSESPESDS